MFPADLIFPDPIAASHSSRQMDSGWETHHSYSFSEMKRNINHMARLNAIKANPEGPKFAHAHMKQETEWEKQYGDEFQRSDLTCYPHVGDEVDACKEGMEIARNKARYVGMVPTYFCSDAIENPKASEQQWFYAPYANSDDEHLENMCTDEELHEDAEEEEQDPVTDDLQDHTTQREPSGEEIDFVINYTEEELQKAHNVFSAAIEPTKPDEETVKINDSTKKVSPTVTVPGYGLQYKSHLVSLLNEKSTLSHDRLTRVRQTQDTNSKDLQNDIAGKTIMLFDDYAFVDENKLKFGRVLRMRKRGKTRGYIEYKYPVSFQDADLKNILCVIEEYVPASTPHSFGVSDDNQRIVEIKGSTVISHVNLSFYSTCNILRGDRDEMTAIEEQFLSQQKGKKKKCTLLDYNIYAENQVDFGGALKTTVIPSTDDSGARSSKRVRTVITHLSDLK